MIKLGTCILRLYPSEEQIRYIDLQIEYFSIIWNHMISRYNRYHIRHKEFEVPYKFIYSDFEFSKPGKYYETMDGLALHYIVDFMNARYRYYYSGKSNPIFNLPLRIDTNNTYWYGISNFNDNDVIRIECFGHIKASRVGYIKYSTKVDLPTNIKIKSLKIYKLYNHEENDYVYYGHLKFSYNDFKYDNKIINPLSFKK